MILISAMPIRLIWVRIQIHLKTSRMQTGCRAPSESSESWK